MITFVEDDDVVRKMVEGILTADGYRVTAAKHFRDLEREAATARPPQLLAATPSAEAERFGRAALARNPELRLLWIRQSEGCPRAVAWAPAKRQGALQKPYALSELLRAARKILDA
jgi:DNA-binding NtrC family response regulator